MPQQTEPSANNALGLLLHPMLPRNQVITENTQILVGHPGLQPDIVITAPGRSPVVVEAEFMPAFTAEAEAKARLGLEVANTGRTIESSIALRYPGSVRNADVLADAISNASLSFCVWNENGARFPESGWLDGGVADLADLIRLVSVPQKAVDQAASALEAGINNAATLLDQVNETRQAITISIAGLLGMTNVPQTRRMACAIIANALVFHERIAGMHQNVKPLALVCGDSVPNPQNEVLAAWTAILDINYWPIFAIARDILQQLPSGDAAQILRRLRDTAQAVNATGVDNAHDLTGLIFQRLIADRKYLATFYTLPASAALLARLAVAKLEGVDWSDPEAIGSLRVADFACGTGALLSAVYDQIAARHERTGGDPAQLHRAMMEEVLYGCDVMPSAIHITGSTLSGVEPDIGFGSSRLYTMPYGRQSDGTVKIGSLELLRLDPLDTSDPTFECVHPVQHYAAQRGAAAFASKAMAGRRLGQETATAGMDYRPHGHTAINGASWAKFRELITKDAIIVSIEPTEALHFRTPECRMPVARKKNRDEKANHRARFVRCQAVPTDSSGNVARAILASWDLRRVEDGPLVLSY